MTARVSGFRDPVDAAQRHFRAVLDAQSRPGLPVRLKGELPEAPMGMSATAFALALSLVDYETPVWLGPGLDGPATVAALRFHCGCPLAQDPLNAAFALLGSTSAALPLERFAAGTPDYPDRSATLIVQVAGFDGGPAARLSGPGIERARVLGVEGAPASFWPALATNHARFPQGVDLVLVAGDHVVGLPRSTAVEPL